MSGATRRLLFVGQAVLDQVFCVERLSAEAGKGQASDHRAQAGGLATNAARAAQRLRDPSNKLSVRLASAVGDDAAGLLLQQDLGDEGIDLGALACVAGARTSVSAVLVDSLGERQIHNFRGDALVRAPVPEAASFDGVVGVLVDPRWPAAAMAALAHARAAHIVSVLDAEVAPREVLRTLVPLADWCVFSRAGLSAWGGDADLPAADALALAARATSGVELVVTLGADGAQWHRPDGTCHVLPAFRVPVVDTNGAGDVMHGALLLSLAEGRPPAAALRRAMAAAALACSGQCPDRAELDRFMETV